MEEEEYWSFNKKVIAIDFDGTLVEEGTSKVLKGAQEFLKELKREGWEIIIWTSNPDLDFVRRVAKEKGLIYDFINERPETDGILKARKILCSFFVDDRAIVFDGKSYEKVLDELKQRAGQLDLI